MAAYLVRGLSLELIQTRILNLLWSVTAFTVIVCMRLVCVRFEIRDSDSCLILDYVRVINFRIIIIKYCNVILSLPRPANCKYAALPIAPSTSRIKASLYNSTINEHISLAQLVLPVRSIFLSKAHVLRIMDVGLRKASCVSLRVIIHFPYL